MLNIGDAQTQIELITSMNSTISKVDELDINNNKPDAEWQDCPTETSKVLSQQAPTLAVCSNHLGSFLKTSRFYLRKPDSTVYRGTQAGFVKSIVEMYFAYHQILHSKLDGVLVRTYLCLYHDCPA